MTIILYIICNIISLFFLYQSEKNKNNKKLRTIYLIVSLSILIILAGFRHISVGVDTIDYAKTLDRIIDDAMLGNDKNWLSIGYIFLNKIVGFIFGNNYVALNFIVSFFTIVFLYKGIIENSEKPTMSLFIFMCMCLYYQSFNQSRQILALSIVIYSYKFLKNRNLLKYCIVILLAASIHKSSLVMLPFYFITNLELNKKILLAYFALGIGTILFSDFIIKIISMTSYGDIYAGTKFFTPQKSSVFNLAVRITMMGGCLFFGRKIMNKDDSKHLFHLIIWCTLLQIITIKINIFGRMTTYFYVFYIFLIPKILNNLEIKNKKIGMIFIICLFVAYHFVYFNFAASSAGYDVYKFFF